MKRINAFAVFTILMAVLLSGCGTVPTVDSPDPLDPNRPYPPQPTVSAEIVERLAPLEVRKVPTYISIVWHYKMDNIDDLVMEMDKKEGRGVTIDDLSVTFSPSKAAAEDSGKFLANLKKEFTDARFNLVDTPCETCLILISDFAESTANTGATISMFRIRAYYRGNEVMKARSRHVWWRAESVRDGMLALAARRARQELEYVYSARTSSWR